MRESQNLRPFDCCTSICCWHFLGEGFVDKLNREINAGLADSKIKARLADVGSSPFPGSPADFGNLIAEQIEKWGKLVKFAGLEPE